MTALITPSNPTESTSQCTHTPPYLGRCYDGLDNTQELRREHLTVHVRSTILHQGIQSQQSKVHCITTAIQQPFAELLDSILCSMFKGSKLNLAPHYFTQNSRNILCFDFFHYLQDGLPVWLGQVTISGLLYKQEMPRNISPSCGEAGAQTTHLTTA